MPFDRSSQPQSHSQRHHRVHPLTWAIAVALAPVAAVALPQDGVVKQGAATIQTPQNGLMVINQSTQTAAVDWRSFSVDKSETVNIVQPNSQALLINRVIGYDPTRILGQINANGRVVLSNPRGVYFSADSQIDVGSLVATTLSISDADLQSGVLRFGASTDGAGELKAEGRIRAADTVALVAPQVTVNGSIDARRVAVAAASQVSVDVEGDGLVLFNVRNDENLETRLNALGTINATQSAELRAVARAGFADTVLNMDGIVRARSLEGVGGKVVVDGGSQGVTWVNGKIEASSGSGQVGGDVLVQGQRIMLDNGAQIDASGDTGGGRIRVGGDFHGANAQITNANMVVARTGAQLRADAGTSGDGGQVVLWSDTSTRFAGTISARGGENSGNGGKVEVSSKGVLDFAGKADLRASAGSAGELLLDPTNLTIQATSPDILDDNSNQDLTGSLLSFGSSGTNSVITAGAVSGLLTTSAVTLQATNNITLNSGASITGSNLLTLQAGRNISIGSTITTNGIMLSTNDVGAGGGRVAAGIVAVNAPLDAGIGTLTITNNGGTGTHTIGGNLTGAGISITGKVSTNGTRTFTTGASASSITSTMNMGGDLTLNIGSGNLTLGSALTDTGTRALTKDGVGTLTLSGTNTYNGGTVLASGTLALGSAGAIGSNGNITLGGGTLQFSASNTTDYSSRFSTAASQQYNLDTNGQAVTLATALTSSGGSLTKSGTGTLTLSGTNTYDGGTTLAGGTLALGNASAIGSSGTISFTGGTLQFTSANSTDYSARFSNSAGQLYSFDTNNQSVTLATGMTSSGGSLSKSGAGTLTLSGANTYDGGTNINGGVVSVSGGGALSDTGAVTLANTSGATLNVVGSETIGSLNGGGTSGGNVTIASGQLLSVGAGIFAGNITGVGGSLTKSGSGTLTLSGTNTYGGGTTLTAGTLALGSAGAIGSTGTITLGGGSLQFSASNTTDYSSR
ncbi:autotransporter-associated beta strand repeat-containing protein, partial [Roseateles sp. BYS78W]